MGVQVGVLGRLWASKLASLGVFDWPNESPKESFGPPEAVEKRFLKYFLQSYAEPRKTVGKPKFCCVFLMRGALPKALGPPS